MIILGIESSCDDTSCAISDNGKILANIVSTQTEHIKYGGIIPELASRAHLKNIIPVVDSALTTANKTLDDIDMIGVTNGPGLVGPLLVGINAAKGFGCAKNIPVVPVNHIESHIFANFIENPDLKFPFLALVVSGGHTELIYLKNYSDYYLIGKTRDDAAGECLDKVSKMIGLGFPGGKVIDNLAKEGDSKFHRFPRGMHGKLDFSFSGLKTAVKVYLESKTPDFIEKNLKNIIASFQEAVVDSLTTKLFMAAKIYKCKTMVIAGGVSANSSLRARLKSGEKRYGYKVFHPSISYCTDNAAMVTVSSKFKWDNTPKLEREKFYNFDFDATPGLRLTDNMISNDE